MDRQSDSGEMDERFTYWRDERMDKQILERWMDGQTRGYCETDGWTGEQTDKGILERWTLGDRCMD